MNCINAQLISLSADNYPLDVLHIWTESDPVDEHSKQLEQLQTLLFELKVADQYPPNVTKQDINTVLSRSISDLGGLDFQIKVKEGAIVMLTTNVDIGGKLINDQMVTIKNLCQQSFTKTICDLYQIW